MWRTDLAFAWKSVLSSICSAVSTTLFQMYKTQSVSYKENCKLPVYQRPELKKRQPEFGNNTVRDMPASLSSLISPPLFFFKKKKVRLHRCPPL